MVVLMGAPSIHTKKLVKIYIKFILYVIILKLISVTWWWCCCCFGDVLNFNKSRSYDVPDVVGSSNINARADSMDFGRKLCANDDTLFVRCVIVVDVDGDDGVIVAVADAVDAHGYFYHVCHLVI